LVENSGKPKVISPQRRGGFRGDTLKEIFSAKLCVFPLRLCGEIIVFQAAFKNLKFLTQSFSILKQL
jgi:hypothetical protein